MFSSTLSAARLVAVPAFLLLVGAAQAADAPKLRLAFLGDNGPHRPARRFSELAPHLERRGIELVYTDDVNVLSDDGLRPFDGLVLYANIDRIEKPQADALLKFVREGKGFIPIHSATYCFRNDSRIVALMGAQFKRHGAGVLSVTVADVEHPILDGYESFSSWDESYIHHLHNEQGRTVLEYRHGEPQAEGNSREPWTWVRTEGEGRVFYTAWGHDGRTWTQAGFQNLVERGIRWACGDDPTEAGEFRESPGQAGFVPPPMTSLPDGSPPFEYVDVGPKIPNYAAGRGQTLNLMQKPLSAEASMTRMVTPEDFTVELFADENIFEAKPIAMNWDERGRLWVCETVDYPHDLRRDNRGRDRIRILEDTTGDGKADKSTVFAEGLNIPTAIAFHRGGAVVQNGSETLYLKDTSGDDVADLKHVLITGWSMGDTHGGVSNFRNGLDNWIWAMQGYNNSAPTTGGRRGQSFRMGFFRFKLTQEDPPQVEKIEFVRSTTNNTWGLGISEEGFIFGSTANRQPSFFMPIANRYYERVKGWAPETLAMISDTHLFSPITDKVRQVDHHGGYTAAAGHAVYTARTYPEAWWNRTAFVCGPTGKLVGTFVLQRDGAGFRSHSPMNLLASDDEWTAPILAEVGPDGNVWVIDWYNYIVQHNPTPEGFETGPGNAYLTDLRDKRFGRVYRIVYQGDRGKGTPETPSLSPENLSQLITALEHPSMQVRLSAQRLLVERGGTDARDELLSLLADRSVDEIGLNVAAIHAVQTLAGLRLIDEDHPEVLQAVLAALEHPSAGVRQNVVSVLPDGEAAAQAILDARLLDDPDPAVIKTALLALADMSSPAVPQAVAELVAAGGLGDRWIADAATAAAAVHPGPFLIAAAKLSESERLSPPADAMVRRVAEHWARSNPDQDETFAVFAELPAANPQFLSAVIAGANVGLAEQTLALSDDRRQVLKQMFQAVDDATKADLIRLTAKIGSDALDEEKAEVARILMRQVEDDRRSVEERVAAAERLIAFGPGDAEIAERLTSMIDPLAPPALAQGLIQAAGRSTADGVAESLIEIAAGATPAIRDQIIQTLLARPSMTEELLDAIAAGDLALTDLTALQRQTLGDHPSRRVRRRAAEVLRSAGSSVDSDRARVVEAKMHLTEKEGNPEAGKLVFTKHCATCHKYQGEGNNVGPDLTGMSVHPKSELLIHILDPSRSVESNYRLYTALTLDGVVINGILAAESRTTVELIDAQAKRHTLLREDIEQLTASRKSAMPDGLEESLGDQGIVDLLEYLTAKGRYVPLPIDQAATAVSTRGMFYDEESRVERLVFDDWGPKEANGVPFLLTDPQNGSVKNAILLHSPNGKLPPTMPKSVMLPCETAAKRLHLLGGVAGWGAQRPGRGVVSMIVRLHYVDGRTEDHPLIDGEHIADYIRVIEVPKSELAFDLRGRQLRYLAIEPKRSEAIKFIEFNKPDNVTAPIVMAITVERDEAEH